VVVKNALDHAFVIIFLAVRFSLAALLMLAWSNRALRRFERGKVSSQGSAVALCFWAPHFKPLACCTPLLQSRDS